MASGCSSLLGKKFLYQLRISIDLSKQYFLNSISFIMNPF